MLKKKFFFSSIKMSSSTETFDKFQTFYNKLNPFLDIPSRKSMGIIVLYFVLIFIPYLCTLSVLIKRQGITIDSSENIQQNQINDICTNTSVILNIDSKKSTLTYVKIGAFMNFILYILLTMFVGLRFINLCQTILSDNVFDIIKFGFLTCTFIILSIVNSISSFILMDVSDDTKTIGLIKEGDGKCLFDYDKDNETTLNFCKKEHPYCVNNKCYRSKQTVVRFGNMIRNLTYFNLIGGGFVLLTYTYFYLTIKKHNSEGIFVKNRSLVEKIKATVTNFKKSGNKMGYFFVAIIVLVIIFVPLFYIFRGKHKDKDKDKDKDEENEENKYWGRISIIVSFLFLVATGMLFGFLSQT